MKPFQIGVLESIESEKTTVKLPDFIASFNCFLLGIQNQIPEWKNIRYIQSEKFVKQAFYFDHIFVSKELNRFIDSYLIENKIFVESSILALIACYYTGFKKVLKTHRYVLQEKYNSQKKIEGELNTVRNIVNGISESPKVVSFNTVTKKKEVLGTERIPKETFIRLENELSQEANRESGFIEFCDNERKIFFDTDFQFYLTFRRYVANSLFTFLEKFTDIQKALKGKSSKQECQVIGLFYHLLYLLNDGKMFFLENDEISTEFIEFSIDSILDDLKGYGKYSK